MPLLPLLPEPPMPLLPDTPVLGFPDRPPLLPPPLSAPDEPAPTLDDPDDLLLKD